jgi:LmbE family N-acetylglucosaminyl deacetylase
MGKRTPNVNVGEVNIVKTVLVFAPHPDDEVFGCGGTIASKIADGFNVCTVFMTDGCHSHSQISPDEIKAIRRKEAVDANNVLGISETELFFLDFEDGRLNDSKKTACKMVREILNQIQPVEIYYPSILDAHPDHKATSKIVESCFGSVKTRPTTFQYVIWSSKRTSARVLDFIDRKMKRKKLVRLNVSGFLSIKEKALSCYESQISTIKNENPPLPPAFVKNFLRDYEEFELRLGDTGQIRKKAKYERQLSEAEKRGSRD